MNMRIAAIAACLVAATGVQPAAGGAMDKAYYMNTFYCAGIAAVYSEKLAASSGHGSKASAAARVAKELVRRAESFGNRNGYPASEGQRAQTQGRSTMAAMLPDNGGWKSGGEIPGEAFRQYQHCATLAEL